MTQTPKQKLNEFLLKMDHELILSYPNKSYLPLFHSDVIFDNTDEKSSLLRKITKYEKLKTR